MRGKVREATHSTGLWPPDPTGACLAVTLSWHPGQGSSPLKGERAQSLVSKAVTHALRCGEDPRRHAEGRPPNTNWLPPQRDRKTEGKVFVSFCFLKAVQGALYPRSNSE